MIGLTERQGDILSYIINFIEENSYAPTYREIGAYFNIDGTNCVRYYLMALHKKGYIDTFGGGARVIKVLKDRHDNVIIYKLEREERGLQNEI